MVALFALAAYQAVSALKQADEIRQSAELTNRLNEVNAKYADIDAYETEKFGFTEAASYQPNIDKTLAAQRSGYASQNVDINFGTAADVQEETKLVGNLNILDIQNQARMKALGFKQQAANIRSGMSVTKSQAEINSNSVASSGVTNAAGTAFRGWAAEQPNKNYTGSSNYTRTK